MDKIILVVYIGIGTSSIAKAREIVVNVMDRLTTDEDKKDIIHYFIPTREDSARVECLNPKLIDGLEYEKITKLLDETKDKLNKFLNNDI